MKVYGMGWVGSRTSNFEQMREFVADKLGLTMTVDQKNAVVFSFADGTAFEVFKPVDTDHSFFDHPVPGLIVDDVYEVRAELEDRGVDFIGEVHKGVEDSWGTAWSHFRAPDGNIYALISRPAMHPTNTARRFDEMRICLKVNNLDEAVRVYRDGLGMRSSTSGSTREASAACCSVWPRPRSNCSTSRSGTSSTTRRPEYGSTPTMPYAWRSATTQ